MELSIIASNITSLTNDVWPQNIFPNITGEAKTFPTNSPVSSGSIAIKDSIYLNRIALANGYGETSITLAFNAANSSSIYNSSTVQPKALTCIYLIKI